MRGKFFVERRRTLLTKMFVVLVFLLLMLSESHWEGRDPFLGTMLFSAGIFLVAIASTGRLWCSLYIAGRKTTSLVTEGPYSICRNPLYFFSLLGAIGVGFSAESIGVSTLLALAFVLYYPFVIKKEEMRLEEIHGEVYKNYKKNTACFFPRMSKFNEPEEYVVNPAIYRAHILSALWFVWIVALLEIIESLHELGILPILFKLY